MNKTSFSFPTADAVHSVVVVVALAIAAVVAAITTAVVA